MIRLATINDLAPLSRLFDLYRQFYQQPSDLTAAEDFLRDRINQQESVIFLAYPEDEPEQLVGFVQLYPTFSSIGLKPCWILNDLFVDAPHRGLGCGEELIEAALAHSEQSGARSMMLQTAVTNTTAQRLYERLGWQRDKKFYSYYFFH